MTVASLVESDLTLLLGAGAIDWCLGEPPAALHPVVWMGGLTREIERRLKPRTSFGQVCVGTAIALSVPLLFSGGAGLLRQVAMPWPILGLVVGLWLLKSAFALRALGAAARVVGVALERDDIDDARRGLASLCSRDASRLSGEALVAATVESLAENTSDSIVAPLFYFALFGLPGAIFYRAVNTLDAMIGYHGRYEYLGKASARLDDLLNFIPSRLTAGLLLLAGALLGSDVQRGWAVLRRDGGKTESPNAGRPMSAMAGLLGVELTKEGAYRLGDAIEPPCASTIHSAWRIVVLASVIAFIATATALSLKPRHVV